MTRIRALGVAVALAALVGGLAIGLFLLLPAPTPDRGRAISANTQRIERLHDRQMRVLAAAAAERRRNRAQQRQIRALRRQVRQLGGTPVVPAPSGPGRPSPASAPSTKPSNHPTSPPRPSSPPSARPTPSPSPSGLVCRVARICQEGTP